MRAFVAVHVPEAVRENLRAAQQELETAMPKDAARWTVFDQLHLTLEFLGDVRRADIAEMEKAFAATARMHRCVDLKAEAIGAFASVRNPRVIWAGLAGSVVALKALQAGVRGAVARWAAEPEGKPYRPHITLGRVRDISPGELRRVSAALASRTAREFGAWTVEEFALVQSELSPRGATHSTLATFHLGG